LVVFESLQAAAKFLDKDELSWRWIHPQNRFGVQMTDKELQLMELTGLPHYQNRRHLGVWGTTTTTRKKTPDVVTIMVKKPDSLVISTTILVPSRTRHRESYVK
jgi:hypothetical protein